jgi:hypothetical protein
MGNFSYSQMALLFDHAWKFVPDQTVSKEFLIENGWMEELVRVPTTRGSNVQNVAGSVRAIRYQYSVWHYIGSTIHAFMGQTLLSLLTRVERGSKNYLYSLWLASQVVVLLSRTRHGEQTIFWCPNPQVGTDKEAAVIETAEALLRPWSKQAPSEIISRKLSIHTALTQEQVNQI